MEESNKAFSLLMSATRRVSNVELMIWFVTNLAEFIST